MRHYAVKWCLWALLLCFELVAVYADNIHSAPNEVSQNMDSTEITARGKKKKMKYLMPFLIGIVVVKSVFIPLALKAMAIVSGKAFLLSALSLILSSILGLKKIAHGGWDRMSQTAPIRDRGDLSENSSFQPTSAVFHKLANDQYWERNFQRM